jgi:hypothetical protein
MGMVDRKMKTAFGILSAGLLAVGLSACANTTDPALLESPNYSMGYTDGCATGNQRVHGFSDTVTRNEQMFDDDEAYRVGWRDGYGSCGGSQVDTDRRNRGDYLSTDRFDSGSI